MRQKVKEKIEKRSTELLVVTALLVFVGAGVTASSTILDSSNSGALVAEYRFDTGSGNTAYDTAGNNDGTINGAKWTSGLNGRALKFDGKDDTVNIGNNIPQEAPLTISGWMWVDSNHESVNGGEKNLIGNYDGGGWIFRIYPDNKIQLWFNSNGHESKANAVPERDEWVHIAATLNKDGKITYYKNGEVFDTVTASGSINAITNDFRLASRGDSDTRNDLLGKLDDVRIYSTNLSSSQVNSLYNSGAWRIGTATEEDDPSKVLEISFQHQNSSHVLDTSGYNNHGARMNDVGQESAVDCKVGRCYSFDGNDDSVTTGFNDIGTAGESFTIMGWFKSNSTGFSSNHYLLTNYVNGGHDGHYAIGSDDPTQGMFFRVRDSTRSNSAEIGYYKPAFDGKWHHYTGVRNANTGSISFYIDGKLRGSTPFPGDVQVKDSDSYFGMMEHVDSRHLKGNLDQVKIFNRSLSQAEIIEKTPGLGGSGTVLDLRFDRDGGDKVHDYSGEENHGTLQPNASSGPKWTEGIKGNALNFDGYNDHLEPNLGSKPGKLTVSAWYKTEGGVNSRELVSDEVYSPDRGFGLESDSFAVGRGDGNGIEVASGSQINGEWVQVVGTYDNQSVKFYQNGELIDQNSFEGPYKKSGRQLTVGYNPWRNSGTFDPGYGWKGKLENIKIYPYALSNSTIKKLYKKGKSLTLGTPSPSSNNLQDGLALSQTFDRVETCGQSDTISCPSGMNGEVAVDESGEANHGELVNNPPVKVAEDCKVGGCLEFDGSNEVRVDDSPEFNITDHLTVSLWIKPNSLPFSDWNDILSRYDRNNGWDIIGVSGESKIRLETWNGGSVSPMVDSPKIPEDNWSHLTLVYNESDSNQLRGYLDGEIFGSDSGELGSLSQDIYIASQYGSPQFNGSIDQVRVYNRSLSKQEVWKLYTGGRDKEEGIAGPVGQWKLDSGVFINESFEEGIDGNKVCSFESDWKLVDQCMLYDSSRSSSGNVSAFIDRGNGEDDKALMRKKLYNTDQKITKFSAWYRETSASTGHGISLRNSSGGRVLGFYTNNPQFGVYDQEGFNGGQVTGDLCNSNYDTWYRVNITMNWDIGNYSFERNDGCSGSGYSLGSQDGISGVAAEPADDNNWEAQGIYGWIDGISVGGAVLDSTGEQNNGKVEGYSLNELKTAKNTEGNSRRGMEFDGSDDYIEVKDSSSLTTENSLSVFTWISADKFVNYESIVHKSGYNYRLMVESGPEMRVRLDDSSGNSFIDHDEDFNFKTDKWYHIGFIYNTKSGIVRYYVDGDEIYSENVGSKSLETDNTPVKIGVEGPSAGGHRRYFDGKLDDVRIYPYALSQSGVKQIMNSGAVSIQ